MVVPLLEIVWSYLLMRNEFNFFSGEGGGGGISGKS